MDSETRAFIDAQPVARLATAGADGDPHLVPVVFALVEDLLYIVIDEKPKSTLRLRRLRNIADNPRAAFLVDVYSDDWSRLRWIMLRGPAEVIAAGPEQARAVSALRARYPQYQSMALDDRPVIRLSIERVTSWSASG
jgi:PPOX class probable F420-dependent enzyme